MEKYFKRPYPNRVLITFFCSGIALMPFEIPDIPGKLVFYSFLAYFILLYIISIMRLPKLNKTELLFSESTASGFSHNNIFTRLGGGSGCIRIRLSKDMMVISSWFPFSLLAPIYDMVHVIKYSSIISIKPSKMLWKNGYKIKYQGENSQVIIFSIFPKNNSKFESVLKTSLGDSAFS